MIHREKQKESKPKKIEMLINTLQYKTDRFVNDTLLTDKNIEITKQVVNKTTEVATDIIKPSSQYLKQGIRWLTTPPTDPKNTAIQDYTPLAKPPHTHYPIYRFRVIDGDTLDIELKTGEIKRLRLLLIDAPEIQHTPYEQDEPYGRIAAQQLDALLKTSKQLSYSYDAKQTQDGYQRELVYLWSDGRLIQELLVSRGYARVMESNGYNRQYLSILKKAEQYAKDRRLNLWQNPSNLKEKTINALLGWLK